MADKVPTRRRYPKHGIARRSGTFPDVFGNVRHRRAESDWTTIPVNEKPDGGIHQWQHAQGATTPRTR
jgi:hypothetical protein